MLRIGILGAGAMARKHIETYALLSNVEIAGVSFASMKSLESINVKYHINILENFVDLLPLCDAIDICLPTHLHEEAVIKFANAGKHVLCEKPIASTVPAAENMINACAGNGVVLMIAHCLRFWPEYLYLKKIIDDRIYGRLQALELERYSSVPLCGSRGWFKDSVLSGGATLDLHIHDADMVLFLLGPPVSVRAREIVFGNCSSVAAEYFYGEDIPSVAARGGWLAESGYPFHASYRVVFEQAVVEWDSGNKPALCVFMKDGNKVFPELDSHDGYYYQLKHFIECASTARRPETASGEDGLAALKLVMAEVESSNKKSEIKFIL